MTILETIKKEISEICVDLGFVNEAEILDFKFDVSFIDESNSRFGDVAINVSLILTKKTGKNFKDIAEEIVKQININIEEKGVFSNIIKNTSIAPNGFINLFLKEEFLGNELSRVANLDFVETKFTNKKVLVEHSAINLFKPFHIGHLMNNVIGESIVKMMRSTRADLKVMAFPSDISIGIAKALFVLKNKNDLDFSDSNIIKILGDAYVEGVKIYDENENLREEIVSIARNLFEKNKETEDWKLFETSRKINIEYFEKILAELGSHFDKFIYESEAGVKGEEIVKENMNLEGEGEVFQIGEGGAIVFDTKRKKNNESDETIKSVFINSEGHPTYEAKDLGLLALKYNYFDFDFNLFITDNEQVPHFEIVLEAARQLNEEWKGIVEKSTHISHGRLNLQGQRLSSRLGNVLTVEDTLQIVNTRVAERLSEKVKDLNDKDLNNLIKNISLSALRVAILKSKPGLNIIFDLDTSISFEGATGPYLLYTYARANSLLEKSEIKPELNNNVSDPHLPLMKKVVEFESLAKKAIEEIAPQLVIKYLFELTQAFNTFYGKVKIIDMENHDQTKLNLYLVESFAKVLKKGMNMIGIDEVERM
jgi:arginyl-tRNA synthetase